MKRALSCLLCALAVIAALSVPRPAKALDELKNTDPDKYYILLDLRNQIVTVYERDEAGEYTRIVRRFLCTTGRTELDPEDPEDEGTPTPSGIWKIGGRERFGKFANFGNEYTRYWTQIVGDIYFHSIMFSSRDVNTLKRGAFNNLGDNVSHGCVRLYVEDAKWLYYYACPGTTVEVSTNEPSQRALRNALRTTLSFSEYNELQKNIFDEPELPNPSAWITMDGARMRKEGKDSAASVEKLSLGDEVEVLLEGDAWVKVRHDGKEGYVKRGYLSMVEGELDTREDANLIRQTVWLMTEPGGGERIVKVPTDTSVRILETTEDGKYIKITYWGEEGYLRANAVKQAWGKDVG